MNNRQLSKVLLRDAGNRALLIYRGTSDLPASTGNYQGAAAINAASCASALNDLKLLTLNISTAENAFKGASLAQMRTVASVIATVKHLLIGNNFLLEPASFIRSGG